MAEISELEDGRSQPPLGSRGSSEVVEPTRAEAAFARRSAEAKATVPHLYLETTARIDPAGIKQESDWAPRLIRATAGALREHPRANGSYRDGAFTLHGRVNVGCSVGSGAVPVYVTIFDADTKGAPAISGELAELTAKVDSDTITSPELGGATFSITVLPGFDLTRMAVPVIPPHAGALAAGITTDGEVNLTLSCDSRIIYGAYAARFLQRIRTRIETPDLPVD